MFAVYLAGLVGPISTTGATFCTKRIAQTNAHTNDDDDNAVIDFAAIH